MKEYFEKSALIDALMMYTWRDEDDREIDDADEKRAFIEGWFPSLPAADVRPVKQGKWTRIDYQPYGHDYRCSECGDLNDRASPFCPNCGAAMKGEEDGD